MVDTSKSDIYIHEYVTFQQNLLTNMHKFNFYLLYPRLPYNI